MTQTIDSSIKLHIATIVFTKSIIINLIFIVKNELFDWINSLNQDCDHDFTLVSYYKI